MAFMVHSSICAAGIWAVVAAALTTALVSAAESALVACDVRGACPCSPALLFMHPHAHVHWDQLAHVGTPA